jgi:hypothetical protein
MAVCWSAAKTGLGLIPKKKMPATKRVMTVLVRKETGIGADSEGSFQYIAATTLR